MGGPWSELAEALRENTEQQQRTADALYSVHDQLAELSHQSKMHWAMKVPGGMELATELHHRKLTGESSDDLELAFFGKLREDSERRRREMEAADPETGLTPREISPANQPELTATEQEEMGRRVEDGSKEPEKET